MPMSLQPTPGAARERGARFALASCYRASAVSDWMTSTLAPLEPQSPGWRPAWPLRTWLLPLGAAAATAVVAATTTTTSSDLHVHVSAATWCLLASTGVLATGL